MPPSWLPQPFWDSDAERREAMREEDLYEVSLEERRSRCSAAAAYRRVPAIEVLDDHLLNQLGSPLGIVHDRRQLVDDLQVAVGPPVIGHAALAALLGCGRAALGVERRLPGQVVIEEEMRSEVTP